MDFLTGGVTLAFRTGNRINACSTLPEMRLFLFPVDFSKGNWVHMLLIHPLKTHQAYVLLERLDGAFYLFQWTLWCLFSYSWKTEFSKKTKINSLTLLISKEREKEGRSFHEQKSLENCSGFSWLNLKKKKKILVRKGIIRRAFEEVLF